MITVNIRKQGSAAIMTIPSDVLKMLNVEVGASLELEVSNGVFTARPARPAARKRYTLAELLRGATPKDLAALQVDTACAREGESGESVGREVA
jgi:antitoxin ChpS